MIRDVLGWLDYSLCAQIALVLFLGVFAAVSVRLLRTPEAEMDHYAAIPLRDGEEN
jgi:cytochrome c oxidase cbb3-type subunit IV